MSAQPPASVQRQIASGAVSALAGQVAKLLIQVGGTAVLARLLSPADYGVWSMAVVTITFLSIFRYFGLAQATVQSATLTPQQTTSCFWLNAALGTSIAALVFLSSGALASLYRHPPLAGIFPWVALSFFVGSLSIQHSALLQRRMQFGRVATIEVASSAVGFVTALTVAWHGGRYWALVAGDLAYQLASTVSIWIAAKWVPGLPGWAPGTGALLRFGAHLTGSSFLNYWLRNADNLLIGRYRGATELGLYDKAYQLLMMPLTQVHLPLSGVCIAGLSRLFPDPARYRSTYRAIAGALALAAIPGVALLAAVSEEFITFLLGADWRASGAIYRALGPAAALQTVSAVIPWLLVSQGRTKDVFRMTVLTVPLTVLAFVAGLPWGAMGVALAYSASEIVRTMILFSVASRTGPVPIGDHYRALLPGVVLGTVVYGSASLARLWTVDQSAFVTLLVSSLVALATAATVTAAVPALRRTIVQYVTLVRRLRENRVGA